MKNWINKYTLLLAALLVWGVACDDDNEVRTIIPVTSLDLPEVKGNTIVLEQTDTYELKVALLPEDANNTGLYKNITYSSDNTGVFTVTGGTISAVGVGTGILTVSSGSGIYKLEKKCIVEVTDKIYHVTSLESPSYLSSMTLGVNAQLDINEIITVLPDNATYPELTITTSNGDVVSEKDGIVTALEPGTSKITVSATRYPDIKKEFNITVKDPATAVLQGYLDRTGWQAYSSIPGWPDASVKGDDPNYILDEDDTTCLVLSKPGKNNAAADAQLYVVIDRQESRPFNYFRIDHRKNNIQASLRVWTASLYGANEFDPETLEGDFQLIQNTLLTSENINGDPFFTEIPLAVTTDFRYIKLTYDTWNLTSSNTIQVAEVRFGNCTW